MPLLPGKSNIGHNIKEMQAAGHKHSQAVAAALREAYGRKNRDIGGDILGTSSEYSAQNSPVIQPGQIPSSPRNEQQKDRQALAIDAYASRHGYADGGDTSDAEDDASGGFTGGLVGPTDGRADEVDATVPDGSHIIDANTVAALGDGNTNAGIEKLNAMFPDSAKGNQKQKTGGIKAAAAKAAPKISMARPASAMKLSPVKASASTSIPSIVKASMRGNTSRILNNPSQKLPRMPHMAGMPKGLKEGGRVSGVKCALSHGEYCVSPFDVKHTVGGGNQEEGHHALDMWMMHKRREQIQKLAHMPPPVKS